jgi:hypothetical protein
VDKKTRKEEQNNAHEKPKPIWTGEVIERNEQERNEQGHRSGPAQEAIEFPPHLPP